MSIYTDHCKTAADVWANARRVQMRRQAMLSRPAAPVLLPPRPVLPSPPPPPPPKPVVTAPETIQTPRPLPVTPGVPVIPLRAVVAATCLYFDLPETAIFTRQRAQNAVFMRHVCMYVATKMTRLSLPVIAQKLIKGDHTTVFHGRAKIAAQLEAAHAETLAAVEAITSTLRTAFPDAAEPSPRLRNGGGYTAEDIAHITRRWIQDGALVREIAHELGREPGALWKKMEKLGLDKMSKAASIRKCLNPECDHEFPHSSGHQQFCCKKCRRRLRTIRERKS